MEALRKIIDSKALETLFPLPESFRNKDIEIIILPVNEEPRRKQRGIFGREEKVLRTFFSLYWGSATPPLVASPLVASPVMA
jgi:hypothetical protein